jgi:hypothetical protein
MALGRKVWDIKVVYSNIAGKIVLDSNGIASTYGGKRWSILSNQVAPKVLDLNGSYGPLVEYRANGNTPDHYRWGQGGNYTIDAEKVFAYRSSTTTLINTGIAADQSTGGGFGARYGYERSIDTGLPHGTPILAIGAMIKSYGGAASDTVIELCQTAGAAATGSFSFSNQPAAGSTITINGTVITFVASGATGAQVNIGADTAATVTALSTALNAMNISSIAASTYSPSSTTLNITYDLVGTRGNAVKIVAGAGSNATASGATLSGGNYTGSFTTVLETVTIPSGYTGLYKFDLDPTAYPSLHAGFFHVRVSRTATALTAVGALMLWYFPWSIN